MSAEFIFVYGTLRKEASSSMSQVLSSYCDFYSKGYMQGQMYEAGGYPGVVESGNPEDVIYGDIFSINSPGILLPILDEYEECTDDFPLPHEYVRKKMSISMPDGSSLSAWVYVYNHDVAGFKLVESGDYIYR